MANGQQFRRPGYNTQPTQVYTPTDADLDKIIKEGDAGLINQVCEKLGKLYATDNKDLKIKKLSTSQIRKVFDRIQRMDVEGFDRNQLQLLRPMLAYAAGRNKDGWITDLQKLMEKVIPRVEANNFKNFVNFFEAIVAYHRLHGGD
ncbi:MAG: hypothetical protein BWY73_00139 [candidate division TA06 bacterium ADurb.Bin417]|uniref:CRISPR system Cms protein Csm2 n=1 Tax=candidate division TA06 bacterium ADurb.Bin417 TaxID=1852828 RepID=A0A1V5MKV5_UNCT6|nr:MAG: hypothetical protein BWY73_00139 [candidate division TA06 bacterium ADurb.Bin417]